MSSANDAKWAVVSERHARAVNEFLDAANGIPAERWLLPLADGKWTPAQVTVHVIQSYEITTNQLRTGEGLKVQTGWLLRQILRQVVLRQIMWTRKLPRGAKAPKILLPGETAIGRDEALDRLRIVVADFEGELRARRDQPGVQLTHHIFGSIDALRGLDFLAVHTAHHGRQLQSSPVAEPT